MNHELRRQRRMAMRGVPERLGLAFDRGNIEMRAKPNGTPAGVNFEWDGYATVYNYEFEMWDQNGDPFGEKVAQGAARRSLANPNLDVPFLIGHNDAGIPLARTKSGTMKLSDDSAGVHTHVPAMDGRREEVRALASAVERGDLDEMSLAFVCLRQAWDDGYEHRTILEMDLHRGDVCAVTHGANPATAGASMRMAEQLAFRRPAAIGGPVILGHGGRERRLPTQPYSRGPHETVTCPQCQSGNDLDARYCDQCGYGLRTTIPYLADSGDTQECRCGAWNAPDAKICDQCGQGLVNDHDADDGYGYPLMMDWGSHRPVERRSLTGGEKSTFTADIGNPSKNSTGELSAAIHRLVQWAGSGSYPQGTTYDDLHWMYNQICAELKKRNPDSDAGGNFPAKRGQPARPGVEHRCPALTKVLTSVRARAKPEGKAAGRPGERRASAAEDVDLAGAPDFDAAAAAHPYDGIHTHAHTDGGGGQHVHEHQHNGDGDHGHGHGSAGTGATVMVDASTGIPGEEVQMSAARRLELLMRQTEMDELALRR